MPDGPLPPLVALGRDLRAKGLPVGTGRILTFVRGVAAIGLTDRTSLYWTARASLVASRADLDTFDATFDAWFRSLRLDDGDELSFEFDLPPDPEALEPGEDALADVEGAATAATWHRSPTRTTNRPRARTRRSASWRRRSRSSARNRSPT